MIACMRKTHHRTGRLTLLAAAAFAGATLLSSTASHATTPADWNSTLNVTPMKPFLHPATSDRIRLELATDRVPFGQPPTCSSLVFATPRVEGFHIVVEGHRTFSLVGACPQRRFQELSVEPLGSPGTYTIELHDEELLLSSEPLEVFQLAYDVALADDGAQAVVVSVSLTDPRVVPQTGHPHDRPATAVKLSEQAGYFWFFDPDNVEVTVKVIDGRAINGHYWLFIEGMTDLGLTVGVELHNGCFPGTCPSASFVNPPGGHLNLVTNFP